MDRSIIHLNIADFAVAVERRLDRRLAGRPVIIAPEGAMRAAVFDMSEEAYQKGVRKGMALRRALRLCRDAAVLPPYPARYEQAMADLIRQALPYSPLIEPGDGDGHLFVDVTGTSRLFGPSPDVAWRLRNQARRELALDPIWSLAANKLVAKVASRLVKPQGEYIVAHGDEEALLAPLPIWLVPGIEGPDLIRLRDLNLTRVHQVTALELPHLQTILGTRAESVAKALLGVDSVPVAAVGQRPPKIVLDHSFGTDTNTARDVEDRLYAMVEQAGRRLRLRQRAARRIAVALSHSDGRRCARQLRLDPATANDLTLFPVARRALNLAWTRRVRLRHLRLTCDQLVFPPAQLPLFDTEQRTMARQTNLIAAMDQVRERFGEQAVGMGRLIGSF